jgi:hypothetical protein
MRPGWLARAAFVFRDSAAKEAAEKVGISAPVPEGASDSKAFSVRLKAYPDTDPEFFSSL